MLAQSSIFDYGILKYVLLEDYFSLPLASPRHSFHERNLCISNFNY